MAADIFGRAVLTRTPHTQVPKAKKLTLLKTIVKCPVEGCKFKCKRAGNWASSAYGHMRGHNKVAYKTVEGRVRYVHYGSVYCLFSEVRAHAKSVGVKVP